MVPRCVNFKKKKTQHWVRNAAAPCSCLRVYNRLILLRHTAADWASAPMGFIPPESGSRRTSVCEERLIQSIGHPSALRNNILVPDVPAVPRTWSSNWSKNWRLSSVSYYCPGLPHGPKSAGRSHKEIKMEVERCGPGSMPSIPATYREVEFWRLVHVHRLLLNRRAPPSMTRRRSHGRSTIKCSTRWNPFHCGKADGAN